MQGLGAQDEVDLALDGELRSAERAIEEGRSRGQIASNSSYLKEARRLGKRYGELIGKEVGFYQGLVEGLEARLTAPKGFALDKKDHSGREDVLKQIIGTTRKLVEKFVSEVTLRLRRSNV